MTNLNASERIEVPPEELLDALLASAKHPAKKRSLNGLHEICKRRYEAKAANWAYQAIGREAEADGVISAKALTLPKCKDHRALIDAWRKAAENFASRKPRSRAADWTESITDAAVRSLVVAIRSENAGLKKHVARLQKLQGTVPVYIGGQPPPQAASDVMPDAPRSRLLPREFEALQKATSSTHLESIGFREGPRGELFNDEGLEVMPVGFMPAVRKLSGAA